MIGGISPIAAVVLGGDSMCWNSVAQLRRSMSVRDRSAMDSVPGIHRLMGSPWLFEISGAAMWELCCRPLGLLWDTCQPGAVTGGDSALNYSAKLSGVWIFLEE